MSLRSMRFASWRSNSTPSIWGSITSSRISCGAKASTCSRRPAGWAAEHLETAELLQRDAGDHLDRRHVLDMQNAFELSDRAPSSAVAGGSQGSSNQKQVPSPSTESKPMRPPMCSISSLLIARPRPVPPCWRLSDESAWANFWNTRLRKPAGISGPRTRMLTRARLSRRPARSSTVSPGGRICRVGQQGAQYLGRRRSSTRTRRASPGCSCKCTPWRSA
ncbi:hypothetical protein SSTU70S_00966 [Stutzerimonas stutzeri]